MSKIVILSSAQQELQPILLRVTSLEKLQMNGMKFHVGQYKNHELYLGLTGVGMVNAASMATIAIERFKPDLLMFAGVAGGMQPQLKIGDVVVITEAAQPEMFTVNAAVRDTPFSHTMIHPYKQIMPPEWFKAATVEQKFSADSYTVHYGRGASTDQFPAPKQEYAMLLKENVLAIDMETVAVYQVGWMLDVDTIAVRGISNVLQTDGNDPDMVTADVKVAPERAAEVVLRVIESL